MYKALLALLILSLICWIIQLLPVISVPVTPLSSKIYLSHYANYTFGVFGICDERSNGCSEPKIGYPSINSSSFNFADDYGYGGVLLPSDVKYTISKLLVVHVVAFCFSSLFMVVIIWLFGLESIDRWNRRSAEDNQARGAKDTAETGDAEPNNDDEFSSNGVSESSNDSLKMDQRDLTSYMNMMLILTIFSVLTTLLAFLADMLLFIPNLSYLGWIQLIPIVSMALITSMLCFIKRSISSRKFFENYDTQYDNEDMKLLRKRAMNQTWDDNSSDDGFFVYTDGFYTRNEGNVGHERNLSTTSSSMDMRRVVQRDVDDYNDEENSAISVNSSRSSIELEELRQR
ncbi:uncharacterized protein LODBEIA_P43080 [Lodderomyces beijingensis]|uniref:PH-response regulator protein palI/RIM9 n=1 Tax=Lodderomyces beijingensis TaxID=1775926 RepID=A0ABP0ZQ89_9ASCO